ncbi:LamG domain-containing protein [Streptomyces sp. NPDC007088]|uniref:LamG domain-containing protein n=1 Tax=Streptomyces sp. NPDC007088 TaxID=3364773 RepID=UPI0036832988
MHVRLVLRTALVAALATVTAATTTGASAAGNQPPPRPSIAALTTGDTVCDVVEATTVQARPTLRARLDDADGDQLTAQFEAVWSDVDGTAHRVGASTGPQPSGDVFAWTVPDSVPDGFPVRWRVRAKDGAGYGPWSDSARQGRCRYAVATRTQPVAAWRLDDRNGSYYADAWAGGYRGLPSSGVRLGDPGPHGTTPGAASFDGGFESYVVTEGIVVDVTRAFTAGVWVLPDETGGAMTAISQSGLLDTPNFTLGTTTDADGEPAWSFTLPSADGQTRVTGGTPRAGEWAYLTGSYDPATHTARLSVDGAPVATGEATVPEDTDLWYFVMGRAWDMYRSDVAPRWRGELADVRVWDRAVPPAEIAELGRRKPRPFAYWGMEATETWENGWEVIPEKDHHADLILEGDAHITTRDPLEGSGSVTLDGEGDYLWSDIPPLDTGRSWAVATKVRLHGTPDRDMAVLSQPGERTDAFTLRYHAADHTWQARLALADESDAATTDLVAPAPDGAQTLALQYDEKAGEVQLYVNGALADSAPYAAAHVWETGHFLQAGRDSAADGAGEHYLDGDIDEVHTWAGALSHDEIRTVSQPGEHPAL